MEIWKRLLWKEYRESGPFVAIGVLLPLLCFISPNLIAPKFRGESVSVFVGIIFAIITVWASAHALEKQDYALPFSLPLRLANRYLVPILGIIPIGLTLGCLVAFRFDTVVRLDMIPLTIGLCIFIFGLCTVVADTCSLIPAILAGLLFSILIFREANSVTDNLNLWEPFLGWGVVLTLALFWEAYQGKHRIPITRIALYLLLMFAVIWTTRLDIEISKLFLSLPSPSNLLPSSQPSTPRERRIDNIIDSDGSLSVSYDYLQSKDICFFDKRIPRRYFISPDEIAPPSDYLYSLCCLDRRAVLFAVQAPNNADIRVIAWDTRTGQVEERLRFTGWRGMLENGCNARHSPDNRYLLLKNGSQLGTGSDLWLLDLLRRNATLLLLNTQFENGPNVYWRSEAIWSPDRLIIQLANEKLAVDLHSLRVTTLLRGGNL